MDRLLAFALASVVIVLIPGPSMMFAVGQALSTGRRQALAAVCGNALGVGTQAGAVAVGLGELVSRSAVAFTAIKLAGAAYLVVLGVLAIRRRHEVAALIDAAPSPDAARGAGRRLLDGVLVGLLNPKTVLFFTAFLPQFVVPGPTVTLQLLAMGAVFAVLAVTFDSVCVLAAGTARTWFARSPRRLALVGGTGGVAMIGLGAGVALTGRPQ